MRNLSATICLTITLLLGSVGASWSADFQKGLTAARKGDFVTALREWKPLADQGHGRAQNGVGYIYFNGKGVPRNYKTAVKWFKLSAKNGDMRGQNSLGYAYHKGNGVPQDYNTAAKWYTLAAEQGYRRAQKHLIEIRKLIKVEEKEKADEIVFNKKPTTGPIKNTSASVERKSQKLTPVQAKQYSEKGLTGDWNKGLTAFKSGDYATALREWTPLADKGNARAQNAMGVMYEKGHGVPKDYKTAVKWYTLAAEQEFAPAQKRLTRIAEMGDAYAQYNLGLLYANAKGVSQDYKIAVKWLTLSAEQGNPDAQSNLGWMYRYGKGVSQDNEYAIMWLTLSAKQGNTDAQSYLDEVREEEAKAIARQKKKEEKRIAKMEEDRLLRVYKENQRIAQEEEKERTKHPRVLSNYYLGDLILEKCVGSGLVSKAILDDWRVRTKRLFELYFEDKKMNIRPSDRDNIKNTAYRFAQDKYNSSSWKMLESVANFGGQLSNANYMKLSSGCSDFLNLANASVNSILNAFGNESGGMKKKPF